MATKSYVVKNANGKEVLRTAFHGSAIRRLADLPFVVAYGRNLQTVSADRASAEREAESLIESGTEGVRVKPPRMLTVVDGQTVRLTEAR